MNQIAFPPRIFICLFLVVLLSACGATAPAATEMPHTEVTETGAPVEESPAEIQPTQGVQGDFIPPPIYIPPPPTAQPAIPERRRITIEFPPQIRAGDSELVRLTLEVDEIGSLTPTAEFAGNVVTGEVIEIPNLYESHNVIAEARFDIVGLRVSPPNLVSQPLAQGQSISFYWSVLPEGVGVYRGTIWLYLRFVDKVSGEESQRVVSAQPVEIEAVNLFGLSGNFARTFGVVGSVVGAVVGFPFLEDIIKFLFGRRRSRRK